MVVMLPRTMEVVQKVDLAVHLPGGAGTKSREATGVPVPLRKLADLLNVISFLVPLWLAGFAALWTARRGREESVPSARGRGGFPLGPVLWLALAGIGALMLLISPGGGWPRDWDDATGFATVVSLSTAGALVSAWRRAANTSTAAPAATLAIGVMISLWGVHASESISLRRIDELLASRSIWSDFTRANAYDILGANQMNRGRFERAATYYTRAIECAPNPRYFHQLGLAAFAMGRYDSARAEFRRSIERSAVVADPWVGLARVALVRMDTSLAMACVDSALVRSPGNFEARQLEQLLRAPRGTRKP